MSRKNKVVVLIKDFRALQEGRAKQYAIWDEEFKKYLATGPNYDFENYKKAVKESTEKFQSISDRIIKITRELKEFGEEAKEVVDSLEKIQLLERDKLSFTADVQLSKKELADDPSDDLMARNLSGLQRRIGEIVVEINDQLEELRYSEAEFQDEDV